MFIRKVIIAVVLLGFSVSTELKAQGSLDFYKAYRVTTSQDLADEYYKKAFKAYLYLSRVNDKLSQLQLASMYQFGLGIKQDSLKAYAWSQLAAEGQDNRDPLAIALKQDIARRLSSEQLAKAEQLSQNHFSLYGSLAFVLDLNVDIIKYGDKRYSKWGELKEAVSEL